MEANIKELVKFILHVAPEEYLNTIKAIKISKTKDGNTYIVIEDEDFVSGDTWDIPFNIVVEVVKDLEIPYSVNPNIPEDVFKQVIKG